MLSCDVHVSHKIGRGMRLLSRMNNGSYNKEERTRLSLDELVIGFSEFSGTYLTVKLPSAGDSLCVVSAGVSSMFAPSLGVVVSTLLFCGREQPIDAISISSNTIDNMVRDSFDII